MWGEAPSFIYLISRRKSTGVLTRSSPRWLLGWWIRRDLAKENVGAFRKLIATRKVSDFNLRKHDGGRERERERDMLIKITNINRAPRLVGLQIVMS